jgi:hypothetical protein
MRRLLQPIVDWAAGCRSTPITVALASRLLPAESGARAKWLALATKQNRAPRPCRGFRVGHCRSSKLQRSAIWWSEVTIPLRPITLHDKAAPTGGCITLGSSEATRSPSRAPVRESKISSIRPG